MKTKSLLRWKYIVVYDESQNQHIKFELDESERLKDKMKRQKKRSLIHPKIHNQENKQSLDGTPKKFEFQTQSIFTYHSEDFHPNIFLKPEVSQNSLNFSIHDFSINKPTNTIKFALPSLVNSGFATGNNNLEPLTRKIILINDIADDDNPNK